VNPLAFASGIYWFVSHRYGANDGSVADIHQLYTRDADGAIATPSTQANEYLSRVIQLEEQCYSDLRQTMFSPFGDRLGVGIRDWHKNFRGLLRSPDNREPIGARAAASFALTPPAMFAGGLFGEGTPNPFSGVSGNVYSAIGYVTKVGTVRDLFESVHSCLLSSP
jgi:hypothetical protein